MMTTRPQVRGTASSGFPARRRVYSLKVVNTVVASASVTGVISQVRVELVLAGGGGGQVEKFVAGRGGPRGGPDTKPGPPGGTLGAGQFEGGGGGPLRSEILVLRGGL